MAARTGERIGRVRMAEVAAHAGVSSVTVSRVLHAPATVAETTRSRVMTAIRELGYLPNLIARSLAATRTGIVAALIPTIDNSLHAETVQAMSDEMRAAGFHLLLGCTDFSLEREEELVEAFLARQAEALYVTGILHTERTRRLRRCRDSRGRGRTSRKPRST
jgi:LacI family gluconate utilization system Gnt-I transcriptional repressor